MQFSEFMAKFNLNFDERKEFDKRFEVFKENLRHFEDHNSKHNFKVGVNMFSHMNEDEFLELYANKETEHPVVGRGRSSGRLS